MSAAHSAFPGGNFPLAPKNVLALCDTTVRINTAENRATTADFALFHDDEPAQIRDALMIIDHERSACLNRQSAYFVSFQLFALIDLRLQRRLIHYLLDRAYLAFH